ncbi:gamma-glutamylcyclotransferase [Pararhizobium mangrovi]|uniref:glutathione-specific gamma-glutamylcyclotransferase n=1 Tax=Pararhizobium mangrovi TaxID=2590452 RepID=A0A506U0K3_9HYPH|nr:gamma-glutamylcyclotransferase [Pararhizobium mangrovi]TPW27300.1 gamma-glutamylcyclotransferase [Pararhizobium mangrovi]
MEGTTDFWVFGYGSLMWRPGFDYLEREPARAFGLRRSLCVRSQVHRGTPERPGLVLGLDRGGSCRGLAYRVRGNDHGKVMAYLRARELVTNVYTERIVPIRLERGERVPAVTYVVDRMHGQYAGALSAEAAVEAIHGAVGGSGPNEDYVFNTLEHLHVMRIRDRWLEQVAEGLRLRLDAPQVRAAS